MNTKLKRKNTQLPLHHAGGMTMLEVLLAIVIFVVGMLALAHLQGNLSRSSGDANTRTVATNIAEELIEQMRSFEQIKSETGVEAYNDIVTDTRTITRGGVEFTADITVEDWFFKADRVTVTKNTGDPDLADRDLSVSDFKVVELAVSWVGNEFQVDEGTSTTGRLGSGNFVVSSIIPSVPVLGAAKVAAEDDGLPGVLPVDYTPGQRPDVIPIALNNSKFKESSTPMPDVVRQDEIVETWFDVITYNQTGTGAIFLRREEFVVASCDCTLRLPSGSENTGFLPTTWGGTEYTEGEWVSKAYGEGNSNQQSQYCDTCCRDHHDLASQTGSGKEDFMYDPWREWTAPATSGAHKHYLPNKQGGMDEATSDGDDYIEACRMVRKDGFFRVAQDFRQEVQNTTAQSFFFLTNNVNDYSAYVTAAVGNFANDNSANKTLESPADLSLPLPGDDPATNTIDLPTAAAATSDQQVARAIYVDHVTAEAQEVIDCIVQSAPNCDKAPGITNYLEVFPFYEIQTTWLAFWKENVNGDPVTVTNDPLADDNSHSRGMASLTGSAIINPVTVTADMHRGNVGLTATDPINELHYTNGMGDTELYIDANGTGGSTPPPTTGHVFSGSISSTVPGVQAANTMFSGSTGVNCTKIVTDFNCIIGFGAANPFLTISGYSKGNSALYICESSGMYPGISVQDPNSTTFDLGTVNGTVDNLSLIIQDSSCP